MKAEETTHKGVHWHRNEAGEVGFYDEGARQWVKWAPGVDAPPLPPNWQMLGVPTKVSRPGWRSPWRVVPVAVIAVAVVFAVVQSLVPSGKSTAKQEQAALGLAGRCLVQDGTSGGHPKYGRTPVACDSPKASVKVLQVFPLTTDRLCPAGSTGYEEAFVGVPDPYVECLQPVARAP